MREKKIIKHKILKKEDYSLSYYMTEGEGKPYLAFFNGIFHGMKTWRNQTKSRELNRDYNFIFFDYQGEGNSTCGSSIDFMKIPEDLKDILANEGIDQVDVLGYSLGGMFASVFATAYPAMVRRLILLNTSFTMSDSAHWMVDQVYNGLSEDRSLEDIFTPIYPLFFSDTYMAKFDGIEHIILKEYADYNSNKTDLLSMLKGLHEKPDLRSVLEKIDIPVLFLTGEDDKIFPSDKQVEASETISNSRQVMYPGGSHSVFVEKHKDVNKEVHSFLVKECV